MHINKILNSYQSNTQDFLDIDFYVFSFDRRIEPIKAWDQFSITRTSLFG